MDMYISLLQRIKEISNFFWLGEKDDNQAINK